MQEYDKRPENCDHPPELVEETVSLNTGWKGPVCQQCGFHFQRIGSHDRVVIVGEYLNDASYKCERCGKEAKTSGLLSRSYCE